jgi:hypothetical protein
MKTKLHSLRCSFRPALALLAALILIRISPDASAQAPPWGQCLSFDGTNDYVSAAIPRLASNYTFSAWVFLRAGGDFWGKRVGVLSATACSASAEVLIHNRSDASAPQYVFLGRCGAFDGTNSTGTVPTNQWVHVAVTVSSNKLVSYFINGAAAGSWNASAYNVEIGPAITLGDNSARRFNGLLDDVRIWNVARAPEQIAEDMRHPLTGTEASLVACWKLDDGAGTTAVDSSPNVRNGLLVNGPLWTPSTVPAFWGTALSFDGVDDYVQAGNIPLANASFTLEAWARRDSTNTIDFIAGQGGIGNNVGLHFGFHQIVQNKFVFGFYENDLFTANSYTDRDWHHWAGTYDAGTRQRRIYRDGLLVASDVATTNYQGSGPFVIATPPWGPSGGAFHGSIDEVRVWNKARSQSEIQRDLNHPLTGTEANLVACYQFDESVGTTVFDATANHYNGTFVSGPIRTWSSVALTQSNVFYPNVLAYTFFPARPPIGPGTLTVSTVADLNETSEFLTLGGEGIVTQDLFVTDGQQMVQVSNVVNLTQNQLAALGTGGSMIFTLTPSYEVNALGSSWARVDLNYACATAGQLTTMFTQNNSFAGNIFDIVPKAGLTIAALDVNVSSTALEKAATVTVFYREGSSSGHENDSAGWTLLGTRTVSAAGQNLPTRVDLSGNGVSFVEGQTYGLYVYVDGAGATMYYTNGTNTFENADLQFISNCGKGTPPFTGETFFPRTWNGTLYYELGVAPVILTQPASQIVGLGLNATFSVTASGSLPLSYQWRKDGANLVDGGRISGAATACLTITNVVESDGGAYSVAVTNVFGTITSSNAVLEVSYGTGVAYLRSTIGMPWGLAGNEAAMNQVFGTNWLDLRYETANPASLLSPNTRFIFMEGSDDSAQEMGTFLTNNMAAISKWVAAGGSLILNAAPNEGGNMNFGFGTTLIYPAFSLTDWAVNAAHPIFNGPFVPVGTSFSGGYFAHAGISGSGLFGLLTNTENAYPVLAEKTYGYGHVIFGGMTPPYYHSPQPQSSNLLANLLAYGANQGHGLGMDSSVLLIWDSKSPTTLALSNALVNAGIDVTLSDTDETAYNGSNPSPIGFRAVIHLNGTTYGADMPLAGQVALSNYVANGGGYIQNEWDAYEIGAGRMKGMRDLILFDRMNAASGSVTYTAVPGEESHPLLFNVPASFTFPGIANEGPAHAFAVNPSTVVMRQGVYDAVAVRKFGHGRVVGFSHAGNYEEAGGLNTLTNANVQQLYINAVLWITRQIPVSYVGIPAAGNTSEFNALRDTLMNMGFNVQVITQGQWSASSVVVTYPGCISSAFGPSLNDISNGVHYVNISDWGSDWTPNSFIDLTLGTSFAITLDAAHPITAGLPGSWTAQGFWHYGGGNFAGWSTDVGLPSLASGAAPVNQSRLLVANSLGSGRAVYIGWNVYGPDANANDLSVLRNSILWSSGATIVQPPILTWHPNAGAIALSWTDTAFQLQSQTNSLGVGLSPNWFDYPGGAVSPVIITPNPTNPAVFFRLVAP